MGRWRFHEPDPAKCPVVDAGGIDLVLVPGLGFGRDGSRLGRGRGYYDRFLGSEAAGAMRVGVAFGSQVVEAVPVESAMHQEQRLVVKVEVELLYFQHG